MKVMMMMCILSLLFYYVDRVVLTIIYIYIYIYVHIRWVWWYLDICGDPPILLGIIHTSPMSFRRKNQWLYFIEESPRALAVLCRCYSDVAMIDHFQDHSSSATNHPCLSCHDTINSCATRYLLSSYL